MADIINAVPTEEIRFHHILIDENGVPEIKLQIGDRFLILRTDPVDVRQIIHGKWVSIGGNQYTVIRQCSNCHAMYDFTPKYCPNCGAKMDGGCSNG